ncbi:MAG: DHHA1 domain-containing protein [Patescibacteria group bacterium]
MKNIAVIYHGDCRDGFGGAYSAWKKFGVKSDYFGMKSHQDPLPTGLKNKEIYIIDFSVPVPVMKKLIKTNKKVVALDHHISAEKQTKLAHEYVYDLKRSGSTIAWKYFHPNKPTPKILQHIEDIDIWRFTIPKTKEVISHMQLIEYDFPIWDRIVKNFEKSAFRAQFIKDGELLLKYEKRMLDLLMERAEPVKFEEYKTLAVNSPILMSELGAAIVKKMPPIGIVWSQKAGADGKIIRTVSLRSNGKVDVSKLAQKYGGGGHKAAAGFSFPAEQTPPWRSVEK